METPLGHIQDTQRLPGRTIRHHVHLHPAFVDVELRAVSNRYTVERAAPITPIGIIDVGMPGRNSIRGRSPSHRGKRS